MYPYAMCQQCDWGNVDCSYANHPECWGIEWSNHAQDPLRCVPCAHCEAGCCRGAQGYEPEWVDLADAFSSTVTKLYADSTAKNLLKNAIAAIPTKALQHRHRQQNTALSTAWQLLYETVYEHVANYAVRHLGQAIAEKIRSHPPAQTCPNVLRPLNDAEAAGICNVLLVTSKCAAGDIVARKPGSKHYAFLSMLEGVAAALGFCLLVWDMASRLGPCCRQKTSERGGCANLTAAELELEADAHAAMLKVFEAVAEGSVRSIRCWKHTGGDAARFACWVTHYRYLFNPMGYLLDDPLYRLARAHHLIGWLAAVFGEDRAWRADVYMRALALLPEELRRIYASPAEVEGATTEQWVEATDLWGPYLLPGRYELTREDRVKGGSTNNAIAKSDGGKSGKSSNQLKGDGGRERGPRSIKPENTVEHLHVECASCRCYKLLPLQNREAWGDNQVTLANAEHERLDPTCPFLVARADKPAAASKLQATIADVDKLNPNGYAKGQLLISKVVADAE